MIDLIRTALINLIAESDTADATGFIRTINFDGVDGGLTFTLAALDDAAPGYRSATLHCNDNDDETIIVFGNVVYDIDDGGVEKAEETYIEHDGPWREANPVEQMAAYARLAA